MPRYKLTLEYDGTGLAGWQRQPNGQSVQSVLEDALQALTGRPTPVQGAGRTDAGVHARGQVAHADLDEGYTEHEIRSAINFHIRPHAVSVLLAERVPDAFSARFSATGRRYLFRILNRRGAAAIDRNHVWHIPVPLDIDAMAEGAAHLVGHHDFTSFRSSECQALSPVKTLEQLDVLRAGEEIHVHAAARSFLHHQVRNMVGTLALVGMGKWRPIRVAEALAARHRAAAGPTCPPQGLYLMAVTYGPVSADRAGERIDDDAQQQVEDE